MTPEQHSKIEVAIEILKRVYSVMRPVRENGEVIYQDNGDFIIQMNDVDFRRLEDIIEDLKTSELEYNG